MNVAHSQILWQLVTAITVILTVVATHLRSRKDREQKSERVTEKLDNVQKTVNGAADVANARIAQLEAHISSAGLPVPPSADPHTLTGEAGA